MPTITGLTAERMLEIEDATIVDGDIVGGHLILTKHDGGTIDAGSVVGPQGDPGPVGSDLSVITSLPVYDVGMVSQIRAGRQLTLADFTALGLNAPIGLWTLANTLNDSSGNGRHLTNKGTVPLTAVGINGSANTAAQFAGLTSQALYIADTGVSDPFRIKAGSMGCWFKTAKKPAALHMMLSKRLSAPNMGYALGINTSNGLMSRISEAGTAMDDIVANRIDVTDGKWHFAVMTYDGNLRRLYLDGMIVTASIETGTIFGAAAPFNIGGFGADGSLAAVEPFFGRVSNAFITNDVLNEEQTRNLYCAKIPHSLGSIPGRISVNVRRANKGASLVVGDFPSSPLRLYNFTGGSFSNGGSQGSTGDLSVVGTPSSVPGADGLLGNGIHLGGSAALTATDTGLPSGTASHTFGLWFKSWGGAAMNLMVWGTTQGTNDERLLISALGEITNANAADTINGPMVWDGEWHFVAVIADNAAVDGMKRKVYYDGRIVVASTVLNSIVLGGAAKFCIGQTLTGTQRLTGVIDGAFVSGAALTLDELNKLYFKSSQLLSHSSKNPGDHIEGMTATDLLAIFDTLEGQHQVSVKVAA